MNYFPFVNMLFGFFFSKKAKNMNLFQLDALIQSPQPTGSRRILASMSTGRALVFLVRSLPPGWSDDGGSGGDDLRALFRHSSGATSRKLFGDLTLRDMVPRALVPCFS
uniref:Uncharacterized protein n=1 Tax=Oryza brachyantha TaxID=4533 RepID=J3LU60_ORYBR